MLVRPQHMQINKLEMEGEYEKKEKENPNLEQKK